MVDIAPISGDDWALPLLAPKARLWRINPARRSLAGGRGHVEAARALHLGGTSPTQRGKNQV